MNVHAHDRAPRYPDDPLLRAAAAGRSVESVDPATGLVWRRFPTMDASAVREAVARARAAQPAWSRRPVRERAAMLERFRHGLYSRREEVAATICRENGKPPIEAMVAEILPTLDLARFYARRAPWMLAEERVFARNPAIWRKRIVIRREPYGVMGIISPWNYPLMLSAGAVLPALVAGNAVVLKPSEWTSATAVLIAELAAEALLPEDLLHVVTGDGSTGAAIVNEGVDKVIFTGSVATGRRVAEACARRMVPVVLELGGSDPAIVLEDADLATTASGIAWGRFTNAGQTCVAAKRVLAVESVHDELVDRLATIVRGIRVGPGGGDATDMGPMIRPEQAAALRAQLDDAISRGARVVARGELAPGAGDSFHPPVLLADVTPEMLVMREETFGPLLPVMRVRDEEEAVRLANDTPFGLAASVWSSSSARAERVASRIEAGTVMVNDVATGAGIAEVPHGGIKESGAGRAHGMAGLEECVRTRTLVTDRFPRWRQPWWFGYDARRRDAVDAFARAWHAPSFGERARSLTVAVRMLFPGDRPL